jgi:serine/threonine protein kinase/tetratricopeptide (TPR) repeat protein
MALSPQDIETLSRLLDAALELEPAAREAWIAALPPHERALAEPLREMLASDEALAAEQRFAELPRLTPTPDEAVAQIGETVGPYRLRQEIGRGGMGSVWLAERADGRFKRQVALKLPRLAWGAGLAERMAREREIGALLEHPAIARLYDAGVDERGRPYLAFEYIDGQPIDAWCESQALGVRQRLELFVQVVKAVAYAHGRLVVHRDLKPSNVLVTPDGQAHLLDFGIAKLLQDASPGATALTREQGRVYTPHYASPEQVAGEPVTVASDVYTLGVLLYELLTGELPLAPRRETLGAIEDAILEGRLLPASTRVKDKATARALRGEIDAILAKAMQREPPRRYSTAEALAQDIERHLQGQTVSAKPDSLGYRLHKGIRRNWVAVSATSAVLIAVLSGSAVAVVQAQKAARSAEREQVVRAFVADVFRVNSRVNPVNAAMRPATPVSLLEGGAQLIQQRFKGQPDMQAELFGVVGGVFSDMGAYKLAADYAVRKIEALTLVQAGEIEQARALLGLAQALLDYRRYVDAELRLHRAIELARNDLPSRLDALAMLARVQLFQEHLKEAQVTTLELESQVKAGVVSPLVRAWSVFVRAAILDSQNHFDRALPLYRQAINLALSAEGPLSLAAVTMRFEVTESLVKQFKFTPARETYAEADKALRELGGAHEIRANYRSAMFAYFLWGYSAMSATEASAQMQGSRARLAQTAVPVPEWFIPKIDMRIAAIQMEGGNLAAGLPQYEASYRAFLQALGQDDNPRESLQVLGTGLLAVGRHEEADRQFRQSLELTKAAGLGLHPYTAWNYKIIALNLRYARRWDEAEKFLDAAPQFERLRGDGSNGDDRDKFLNWERAALQLDRGRVKEAVQLLMTHAPEGEDADALSGYNGTLGEALCRDHQPAKGLALLKKVQQTYDANGSFPDSPDYGNLWALIGRCAFDAGDRVSAATYAAKARAVFAAQPDVAPYLKASSQQLDRLLGIRAAPSKG